MADEQALKRDEVMAFLNAAACAVMRQYEVHACTDITGFGLRGHLYEMAKASGTGIELSYKAVPIFDSVIDAAETGIVPAGAYSNRNFVKDNAEFADVPRAYQDVLFDPQTSGGLVISVPQEQADGLYAALCAVLENTVCGKPAVIGRVVRRSGKILRILD